MGNQQQNHGKSWDFIADFMEFYSDSMGFIADLMEAIADFMEFYSDSMGYSWDIPGLVNVTKNELERSIMFNGNINYFYICLW